MYKHILIPTDGSELSDMAITQGIALAKALHAKVTVLTVSPTFGTVVVDSVVTATPEQYRKDCEARAEKYLGVGTGAARAAGVPCETLHGVHDHPYQMILETATAQGCDLICMAPHGHRGVIGLVLGGETTRVLTHGKIPVLVCR